MGLSSLKPVREVVTCNVETADFGLYSSARADKNCTDRGMRKFLGRGDVHADAKLEWPVQLRQATVGSDVRIGRYTYLRQNTHVSSGARIGRYCSIARNVEVGPSEHPVEWMSTHCFQYDNNFFRRIEGYKKCARIEHPAADPTVLGNDVWVGAQTVVRRGTRIGNGAIIGANSFVNADVPSYAVVAGSPARVIRYRFNEATIALLEQLKWWDLLPTQMDGVQFNDIETALEQIQEIRDGLDNSKGN